MPEAQQLSQEAYDRLAAEFEDLTTRGRIEIARKLEAARELGDLSENGDYHAAKEEQGKREGRILHLGSSLEKAEIVEVADGDPDVVATGLSTLLKKPGKKPMPLLMRDITSMSVWYCGRPPARDQNKNKNERCARSK